MKNRMLLILLAIGIISVSIISIIVTTKKPPDDFIPKTPQRDLPKGVKARIGKGRILDVAYVPESTQFAVGSSTGIWFYDANTLEEVGVIQGNTSKEFSMSFSPDGKILATTSGDKTVHLWDTETLQLIATFIRDAYHSPNIGFDYVSFIGDGQTLASRYLGGVDFWDTTTFTHHSELSTYTHGSMAFCSDGRLIAYEWNDGVQIVDVAEDKKMKSLKVPRDHIESFAFSPDGQILACGTRDKLINLWDIDTSGLKKTIIVNPIFNYTLL